MAELESRLSQKWRPGCISPRRARFAAQNAWTRVSPGDHICVAYQSPEEQLAVAIHYIAQGLNRREQCLYAADSPEALNAFRTALGHAGVDARGAERDGSLLLLTKHEAHLLGGVFDAERMLHMLSARVEAALNEGYVGLRTCGDMSWLLDHAPNSEQVVEYEALLNQFFASVRATGMCRWRKG